LKRKYPKVHNTSKYTINATHMKRIYTKLKNKVQCLPIPPAIKNNHESDEFLGEKG